MNTPGKITLRKLPKSTKRDVLSRASRDEILDRLNPLQEITIFSGTKNQAHYGRTNVAIEFNGGALSTPGTGSGNMNYRGMYDATQNYSVDDVVYTGTAPANRYFYVAEIANGVATTVANPDPTEAASPLYWRLIAQPPGGTSGGRSNYIIGTVGQVNKIAIAPNGTVYISGQFSRVNYYDNVGTLLSGNLRNGVARLYPSMQIDSPSWFLSQAAALGIDNNATGLSGGDVRCYPRSDNAAYVVGNFSKVNTIPAGGTGTTLNDGMALMNADGSVNESFTPGTAADPYSGQYDIVVCYLDRAIICGGFTSFNGTARYGCAMIGAGGAVDGAFVPPLAGDPNKTIHGATQMWITDQGSGAQILAVGSGPFFNQGAGMAGTGLVRFDLTGTLDPTLNIGDGFGGPTACVCSDSGKTTIYVGGGITWFNNAGNAISGLVKMNWTGTQDMTWTPTTTGPGYPVALCLQSNGKLLVGGAFDHVNGIARAGLARLNADGSLDTSFIANVLGGGAIVEAIVQQSNGNIIVGGSFTSIGGRARNNIAHLDILGNVLS